MRCPSLVLLAVGYIQSLPGKALTDFQPPPASINIFPAVFQDAQELVTSSGTTEDFETYDFDYFTDYITISAVFTSEGQTLDIAEVPTKSICL